ncbi:MAG TPA: hypothetical protein VFU47_02610 [Armatimonadota bacterium]|nr:hypothetical protein [Armatimonadota bacterium]
MPAQGKINAAGIAKLVMAGTPVRVLVEVTESGALVATNRKTGVESVEIVKAEAYQTPRGWHRSGREYVLETSSGRRTVHVGPIQTFIETEATPAAIKRAHIEALEIERERTERAFLKATAALATDPEVRAEARELLEETEAPTATEPETQEETETPAETDSSEELTLNSQGCKVDTNSTDEPEGDEMSTETTTEIPTQTAPETAPMEHTGSTVVALIERVWDRIRADHPELPRVVVTTGSGEFVKWGHFRPDSWKSGDEKLHEFFLASEALAKGAVQVLQTTIHEAAHTLARVRGQKDTSRQNRYHNKVFLALAEELGLEHKASTPDSTHGFSFVTLTEATKEKYADLLEELAKELVLTGLLPFWLGGDEEEDEKGGEKITKPKGGEDEKGKAQTGNLKAVCKCAEPNIIRLSRKVLDKGIVRCDECGHLFREG